MISSNMKTSYDHRQAVFVAASFQGKMEDRARHIQGFIVQLFWRIALDFA